MKAGYEIKHNASDDALGDNDTDIVLINNFNGNNTVLVNYASSDDTGKHNYATPDSETVAIFRIRHKVHCDSCNDLAKCKVDDYGDMICQKCQDNRDEEQGTLFLNDAERPNNDYAQYKSLK